MKVEESLNVTFDESPPPTKLSPLVDDDVGEEEAIRKNTKIVNTNNEEDESIVCNGYSQKDKNKAKTGQNQARDWKERGKPKPKAYAS
ncbi:hypothetical protein Tco_0750893 [Tanacetum coccineum]|uniref:Uncharacterized protein n=1 Tax=Tanacetum coccineum TaxID=301880 RepID=A0ABQ4Z598_9ASTR